MWMLAAAVIAAQGAGEPANTRVQPARQAQAMVRIVSAAVIDLDSGTVLASDVPAQSRATRLRLSDGSHHPAKLLEFQ